ERAGPAVHPRRHARRRVPRAHRSYPRRGGAGMKGAAGWLNPFWQLLLMRLRTFTREPAATFWVFGFPLLMSIALGLAFRNQAGTRLSVAVAEGPDRAAVVTALRASDGLSVTE